MNGSGTFCAIIIVLPQLELIGGSNDGHSVPDPLQEIFGKQVELTARWPSDLL
jgi:hypothetical protein